MPRRAISQTAKPDPLATAIESAAPPATASTEPFPAATVNTTNAPGAGFPYASLARTRSGAGRLWFTTALCASPEAIASWAGAAGDTIAGPVLPVPPPTRSAASETDSARVSIANVTNSPADSAPNGGVQRAAPAGRMTIVAVSDATRFPNASSGRTRTRTATPAVQFSESAMSWSDAVAAGLTVTKIESARIESGAALAAATIRRTSGPGADPAWSVKSARPPGSVGSAAGDTEPLPATTEAPTTPDGTTLPWRSKRRAWTAIESPAASALDGGASAISRYGAPAATATGPSVTECDASSWTWIVRGAARIGVKTTVTAPPDRKTESGAVAPPASTTGRSTSPENAGIALLKASRAKSESESGTPAVSGPPGPESTKWSSEPGAKTIVGALPSGIAFAVAETIPVPATVAVARKSIAPPASVNAPSGVTTAATPSTTIGIESAGTPAMACPWLSRSVTVIVLPTGPTGAGVVAATDEADALTPPGTSRTLVFPDALPRTDVTPRVAVPSTSPPKSEKEIEPPDARRWIPGVTASWSADAIEPSVVVTVYGSPSTTRFPFAS